GDSTSNANNGTNNNAKAGRGQIDGASSFDGSAHSMIDTSYAGTPSDFTVSAWFKSAGRGAGNYDRIVDKSFRTGFVICRDVKAANTWGVFILDPKAASPVMIKLNDGSWHYIVARRFGTTLTVSGDGGVTTKTATVASTALDTRSLRIGWSDPAESYNTFDG